MHILECYVNVILFIIHTSALHRTHATLFGINVSKCHSVLYGITRSGLREERSQPKAFSEQYI